jgi:hypothetical protein
MQSNQTKPKRWYSSAGGFFQLPRALCYDDRLSHTQRTIMLTLGSHVFLTDTVFPSRMTLHVMTGIDVSDISGHTGALEKMGWLKKLNASGQTTRYVLKVPAYAVEKMKAVQADAAARRSELQGRRDIESAIGQAALPSDDTGVSE